MENEDLTRLHHMLDSVNAILSFVKGENRSSLDTIDYFFLVSCENWK